MDEEGIRSRFKEALDKMNLSTRAFALQVGIDPSNFAKKMKGVLNFTTKDYRAVSTLSVINPEWLVDGTGEMFNEEPQNIKDVKGVPYYDVDFNLGFDGMFNVTEYIDSYISIPGYEQATCWCRTTGNSMYPLIESGDLICLKEVNDWSSYLNNDEVYAVVTNNGMRTVKKVVETDDRQGFRLIPENKDFHEQTVPKSIVLKVYHVLGVLKHL